jgi:ankyrin repeat protein
MPSLVIQCGNLANLQALVELGAEIETEDYRGNTPLQCAVNTRQVHVWPRLLLHLASYLHASPTH